MSAMFRPPIAITSAIGWRQVFGFGHGDDPFFAGVRAAQLAALNRYVPFNVALMTINIAALVWSLRDLAQPGFLVIWGGIIGGLILLWTLRFRDVRRHGDAVEAGKPMFWMISSEIIALGVLWGALLVHLLPMADADAQEMLVLVSLTGMGACGFAVATMPVAAIGLVATIGTATLMALPAGSYLSTPLTQLVFLTFALVIVRGVIVSSFEMMGRMRTQADLGERTEVVRLLLNEFEANGSDWLMEVDTEGRLTHVSPRLADVAKRPRAALLGQRLLGLLCEEGRGAGRPFIKALTGSFIARRAFRDITIPVAVAGETRWWALSGTPKINTLGQFSGFRGVGRDVTEVRRSHERIAQLARFDPLTGLANRALFRESLADALARATRTRKSCALLFIDLDRFKAVNDTMGHSVGDKLLGEVSVRLREAVGGGGLVARLGGDEFAVMLPDASGRRAETVARNVVAALCRPFNIEGKRVGIGASVGFALGPSDGASVDHSSGRVTTDRAGRSHITYALSTADQARVRASITASARMHLAAGASEVSTFHTTPVRMRLRTDPDSRGSVAKSSRTRGQPATRGQWSASSARDAWTGRGHPEWYRRLRRPWRPTDAHRPGSWSVPIRSRTGC